MRKLPNLHALSCFEAVADFESFTAAANALNLTHSAISHQIRALEQWFGKALFLRHSNGVTLTPEGRRLKATCAAAFEMIGSECATIRSSPVASKVTIGCSSTFLTHWLLPKLEAFSRDGGAGRIGIRFDSKASWRAVGNGGVDLLIAGEWPRPIDGIERIELFEDRIGPVCRPQTARTIGCPADLADCAFLHAQSRSSAWRDWSQAMDLSFDCSSGETFETLALSIEAARAGIGIAIAPRIMVEKELRAGALVAPFGFSTAKKPTYLYHRRNASLPPPTRQVRDWLISELQSAEP